MEKRLSLIITNKWILGSILLDMQMRLALVVVGVFLTMVSIPGYYLSPHFLIDAEHSFIGSMSGGNMNTAYMLRQMGYPSLHQLIPILQYSILGIGVVGIGMTSFGFIAKKIPKSVSVKLVTEQPLEELRLVGPSQSSETKGSKLEKGSNKVMSEAVNDVLGNLETELKEIRTGYEDHKQKIENEKKKLEQREREQLAKIIATGEVLIKKITHDKYGERIKYYIELKNEETGQPADLSSLAQKFIKMKKALDSTDKSYITATEFENMTKYLDE